MDEDFNISLEEEDNSVLPQESQLTEGRYNAPISLVPEKVGKPLTLRGQKQRASMANYAMQERSPGLTGVFQAIQDGREDYMRQQSAIEESLKLQNRKTEVIGQIASGEVFPEEKKLDIQALASTPPMNPDTVWEDMWATNYSKELISQPVANVKDALDKDAEKTFAKLGFTQNMISERNQVISLKQEFDKRYEDLPWVDTTFNKTDPTGQDKLGSWLHSLFPLANNLRMRNAVPGSEDYSNSILPGNNLSDMVDFSYLVPKDKFYTVVKTTAEALWQKNPHMAQAYLDAMVARPTSDATLENVFGIVDAATLIPGAWIARSSRAAVKAAEKVVNKEAVAVTQELAEAGKNIWFTPEQIKQLQENAKGIEITAAKGLAEERKAKTVYIPHQMPPEALQKAQDAFSGVPSYTRSWADKNSPVGFSEAPEGIPQRPVIKYSVGDQTFNVNKSTVFVSPEEANKLGYGLEGLEETPRRIFKNKQGDLEIAENINGRWTPTGETLKTIDEPKAGDIALSLGPGRKSMGTEYWATPRRDKISGVTRSVAYEDATPRNLTLQQWTDLQGSLGRNIFPDELKKAQDAFDSYLASSVKALEVNPMGEIRADIQNTLSTLGRVDEAATVGAVTRLQQAIFGLDPMKEFEEFGKQLISLGNPNAYWDNPSALSRELADRKANSALQSTKLLDTLKGPRVMRQTEEDLQLAIREGERKLKDEFNHLNDSIVDVKMNPHVYNPATNTYHVSISIGKTDGTLFDTAESARNTMNMVTKIPPNDYSIRQSGGGYIVDITRPIKTDDPLLKNSTIPTGNVTPRGWLDFIFTNKAVSLRSAEDTTSELQRSARHIATSAQQQIKAVVEDMTKNVKISREEMKELGLMLDRQRVVRDDKGRLGAFYKTSSEVEDAYLQQFGKRASDDFLSAYDTYVKVHEFDGLLRKLNEVGNMQNWGARVFSGKIMTPNGDLVDLNGLVAREVDKIDFHIPKDRSVYISDSENKTGKQVWTSDIQNNLNDLKKDIDDKLEAGYKIYQFYDPYKKPLSDATGHKGELYYLITNSIDKKRNINMTDGFEWRQGVHHEQLYPYFIKQPIIGQDGKGQWTHFGDHTFRSGGATEAEAKAWAEKYETARKLLAANDDAALDAYLRLNLPESIDDFKKLFQGENALDISTPIAFTKHGSDVFQSNPNLAQQYQDIHGTIRAYGNDPSNPAGQISQKFMQERADQALQYPGQVNGVPLTNAPMIDPFVTIQRSVGQAIRSRYMDDYRHLAAESFVKEFGHLINAGKATQEAMARNPFYYSTLPPKSGIDIADLAAYQNAQRNVQNFLGLKSEVSNMMDGIQMRAENLLYSKLGAERTNSIVGNEFVSTKMIPFIKDPTKFMRAAAFQLNMGFWNPVQIFVQSQALAHITALAPRQAPGGFVAGTLWNKGLRVAEDPAVIDGYAKLASKWGWNEEHFKEAVELLKSSGTDVVGKEQAILNDLADPKLTTYLGKTIIDKGPVFFNTVEKYNRNVGFFTAYREWRAANPDKVMDQYELGKLMNRYDNLTLNMTRASNSSLQEGALGVTFQFQTFNQRLAEQMLGKRLTWLEKGRVLGVYSALYGIPTALSTSTMFGYVPGLNLFTDLQPNYDDIRKYAIDNGYTNFIDSAAGKVLMDGIVDASVNFITGKDLNITKRYGPGASTWFKDVAGAVTGDQTAANKNMLGLITGPSGQFVGDMANNIAPFLKSVVEAAKSDEAYPLVLEDFISMVDEIKTLGNAAKWAYAVNVGKLLSKNGTYIGDVNGWDGFVNQVFGLTPQKFEDMYHKRDILKGARKLEDAAIFKMQREYGAAMQEYSKGNTETGDRHMQRAWKWGKAADMTVDGYARAFGGAAKNNTSLYDQIEHRWLMNDPRATKQENKINDLIGNK